MVSLIAGCFHGGRPLLGLAEGTHRHSFWPLWQREGLRVPFFMGTVRRLARHRHGTHHQHGSDAQEFQQAFCTGDV
jgi:hypothetical protein